MTRRPVSPLSACMAQDLAIRIAKDFGIDIGVVRAQALLTMHTDWPWGTAESTRRHLSRWFATNEGEAA